MKIGEKCPWSPKPGTKVCAVRKRFDPKTTGVVLDRHDPRAWRVKRNWRDNTPFPWTDNYGSDHSHGRSIPERSAVERSARHLVLAGWSDYCEVVPVEWDFGGYRNRIYWEYLKNLKTDGSCGSDLGVPGGAGDVKDSLRKAREAHDLIVREQGRLRRDRSAAESAGRALRYRQGQR